MKLLFWLLLGFDLLIALFLMFAKGFRHSFSSSNPTAWYDIVVGGSIIGGLALRFLFKRPLLGLAFVALPGLVLLGWYLFDKIREPRV